MPLAIMGNEKRIVFDPFCLDLGSEQLWRGSQAIKLRPKAFAVLDHLVGRPGQLVTKDDLLNAVWPGTFVSDAVLKVAIRQIRDALGDDSKTPRFIETAHRRGYRFIGLISEAHTVPLADARTADRIVAGFGQQVVGRGETLAMMRGWLEKSLAGERQIVFVTGEAGIGKTSLVDTFVQWVASDGDVRVGRGQCLEQYGTGEAYLPVLEAISRLCREQPEIVGVLRAHAPMWLLQMPSLLSAEGRELLGRAVSGATRERMLREICEALEALTAERPLVLILEDLHWSDYSTLDLISYLARKRQPAKLMVIGTYRPADLIITGHPLKSVKQELVGKQQCEELPLEYLTEATIGKYLSLRFPGNVFPAELARLIHERTDGNPLFLVNAADYLLSEKLITQINGRWELTIGTEDINLGVPDSIKQMIEKQLDHLDPLQRRTLEAASVAGVKFSTFAVVAALKEDRASVEAGCEELSRQHQFIQEAGVTVLPSGEAITRYRFIHELYQSVLYERSALSRRMQFHRRIGEQLEALYGEDARAIAAQLAMHFERAGNHKRAAKYFQHAADNAIRRFAYREAVLLSRRGLELLLSLPDTPERAEQELSLHLTLGMPLIATEGYAAAEVGAVYLRARELCRQLGDPPDLSEVLWGLWTFYTLKAELRTARNVAEELLQFSQQLSDPALAVRGLWAMEATFTHLGEHELAVEHYQKAVRLYDPRQHLNDGAALHPAVAMPCFAAWALWLLGEPDQATDRIHEALKLAREIEEPLSLAHARLFGAILHQLRREPEAAIELATAAIDISNEHGLVLYRAMATIMQGWALSEYGRHAEAIERINYGLEALQTTATELVRPHFLGLLAEALLSAGRYDEAVEKLREGLDLAERGGERYYEAELYRLKGEILLKKAGWVDRGLKNKVADNVIAHAEDCFDRSMTTARKQKSRSWQLRTATSLFRLYYGGDRQEKGVALLKEACETFREGLSTPDLRDAKVLLERAG
jgi:DNA-binding winged helix-turn-helix (wHTH) protein/predicted ATPase